MFEFDDIPDISHVESFLSNNNVSIASDDEVWTLTENIKLAIFDKFVQIYLL